MLNERIAAAARMHRALSGLPETDCVARRPERNSAHLDTSAPSIVLPPRRALGSESLDVVLARRRSVHRFAGPLAAAELSDVLGHACGAQQRRLTRAGGEHVFMTAPSAGGLASIDVCVVDLAGSAVPAGVYRYERIRHELNLFRAAPRAPEFAALLTQPEFVEFTTTFVILVARMDRTMGKYPLRHYRTLHVDAGVVAQNLYLASTAVGTGCCAIAGFHDDAMAELLGTPESAFPVLVVALGRV